MTLPSIAVDSRKFNGHDFIDVHVGEYLLTQPDVTVCVCVCVFFLDLNSLHVESGYM